MGKPIKFKSKKHFKIVNKCIMCGKIISMDRAICIACNNKRIKSLKKRTKERRKIVSKEYCEKNKERLKEGKINWYQENKEEIRKHENEYRQNHKKRVSLRNKKYKEDFPEKIEKCIDNRYFGGNRLKALKRDKFACQVCGMTEEEHLKKWNYSFLSYPNHYHLYDEQLKIG